MRKTIDYKPNQVCVRACYSNLSRIVIPFNWLIKYVQYTVVIISNNNSWYIVLAKTQILTYVAWCCTYIMVFMVFMMLDCIDVYISQEDAKRIVIHINI